MSVRLPLIERLHRAVDVLTAQVERHHVGALACKRGCSACCLDDLTVFSAEAERISAFLATNPLEPGPVGACAFLDSEGACRIYEVRPYVCRTQGLPLRWHEEEPGGDSPAEFRDICEKNAEITLETIPAEACFLLGPVEAKLREVEGNRVERIPLREICVGSSTD